MSDNPVKLEYSDDIAVITINNPPVNALGQEVRKILLDLVIKLDADPKIRAVILTGAGNHFVGGADIKEFQHPPQAPHLPELVDRIELAAKPWIAAVNGTALGGGVEIALGCRFRLAAPGARFALPEVNLGIIPGSGGTQRLPRLIGVEAAIPVVAENQQLDAPQALKLALIDKMIEGPIVEGAKAFANEVLAFPLPPLVSKRPLVDPGGEFWRAAEVRLAKSARGAAAPPAALAALRIGAENGFTEGYANERETFLKLKGSDEAAALRYLFFAERSAFRPATMRHILPRPIELTGVVGGGTMGVGIAAALRNAGLPVVFSERDESSLERGLDRLKAIFVAQAKRGIHSAEEIETRLGGVTGTIGLEKLAGCDLVIEAVFEELGVKREVFDQLDRICRADALLATNTSYLDPHDIAENLSRQERFFGLHFFSPAHVMKLVEIVPTPQTASEVLATGFALARRLGKVPIRSGICEGFIGNRILKRYRAEAEAMVEEGMDFSAIDAAMRGFGFGMGPFEMQDLAGLDIAYLNREAARSKGIHLAETLGDILVRAGRKGQKTGGGWYDYEPGDRKPLQSERVAELLAPRCAANKKVPSEVIVDRLISTTADEGRTILDEGIADSAEAIDLVEVHGFGFPRIKGGPMFLSSRKATKESKGAG
jgi:3-hydroxyacyl-CoA dehydrogenase